MAFTLRVRNNTCSESAFICPAAAGSVVYERIGSFQLRKKGSGIAWDVAFGLRTGRMRPRDEAMDGELAPAKAR